VQSGDGHSRSPEVALGLLLTFARASASAARLASRPARVVAGDRVDATEERLASVGRDAASRGAEQLVPLIEDALDGPLPDLIERLLEGGVLERLAAGPAFERVIEQVAASPALRAALAQQTTSFADEIRAALRARCARVDDRLTAAGSRLYGGPLARSIALVLDLALVAAGVALAGASVGLIAALGGAHGPAWLVGTSVGAGWVLAAYAYLVLFWSTVGQTLGMRIFGLRVVAANGAPPGVGRSVVRAFALALAIIPFFAGLAPVLVERRRRGLHDMIAGTTVRYDEPRDLAA
jgi:uncharacterized RDD family membrane protein YckC